MVSQAHALGPTSSSGPVMQNPQQQKVFLAGHTVYSRTSSVGSRALSPSSPSTTPLLVYLQLLPLLVATAAIEKVGDGDLWRRRRGRRRHGRFRSQPAAHVRPRLGSAWIRDDDVISLWVCRYR